MERVLAVLRDGQPARKTVLKEGEERPFRMLQLLSSKPVLYVCNVEEDKAEGATCFRRMLVLTPRRKVPRPS